MSNVMKIYFCVLLLFCGIHLQAQNVEVSTQTAQNLHFSSTDSSAKLIVKSILVYGNNKTKTYIILREIHLKNGDTVIFNQLNEELQKARQQVYNTKLFNAVEVEPVQVSKDSINIVVHLKERLYTIPLPKFQLVDRNINEWIQKSKLDLNRVIYGIKFTQYNLTGRRDYLRFVLLNGYTRNYSFTYSNPSINKKLTKGFIIGGGFVQNKDFIYKTGKDNKPIFFNNGQFASQTSFANIGYSIRKNIFGTHFFNLAYSHVSVTDSLIDAVYNPNYFKQGNSSNANLIDLSYTYQYVNTNNVAYPLKGITGLFKALKRGLDFSGGTNMFFVEGNVNKFWDLKKKWYASMQLFGKLTLPFDQSYINQRALGYSDINLRGLELYVVDGVAIGLLRTTLKRKLFSFNIHMPFKSKQFGTIPFSFFAKTYGDLGYVYNKEIYQTNLNNKLLYSGGFGLDILTLFDVNLRVDYSFNQLGKNGLFLQPSWLL